MSFSVLVLDDEPWQLSWIADLVAAKGGSSKFVPTYAEAKDEFARSSPEIVVVDIRIGDVNEPLKGATLEGSDPSWVGLRFVRHIRVEHRDSRTKILVYTALDREELQRIVEGTYGAQFFTKFEAARFRRGLLSAIAELSPSKVR